MIFIHHPALAGRGCKQYIEPLKAHGERLGSPAIAFSDEVLNWMQQFLNELDKVGGRIDFLASHWYGRVANNFINWITKARQRFGDSVTILDSLSWVERYAWFGAQLYFDAALDSTNCLIACNGQLSELGQKYVYGF
ncbi:unnamed protein product [Rotaria magnacalcarata]|uniref:Asl1-like glycosyl hydrolase catalytic domain-containing protein n=2 Tax=Rotaria magnacalcarata TaxID=392030 RepID=A0A8S3E332_9BILA|nr:unnamed protein product [Rotaria magnacalcarata]CAF5056620.1 unnamed protein product [Rotaria magnacalcarata]CAF5145624.1 unnamed protein product [Rotaria magnacalcarata]